MTVQKRVSIHKEENERAISERHIMLEEKIRSTREFECEEESDNNKDDEQIRQPAETQKGNTSSQLQPNEQPGCCIIS